MNTFCLHAGPCRALTWRTWHLTGCWVETPTSPTQTPTTTKTGCVSSFPLFSSSMAVPLLSYPATRTG